MTTFVGTPWIKGLWDTSQENTNTKKTQITREEHIAVSMLASELANFSDKIKNSLEEKTRIEKFTSELSPESQKYIKAFARDLDIILQ